MQDRVTVGRILILCSPTNQIPLMLTLTIKTLTTSWFLFSCATADGNNCLQQAEAKCITPGVDRFW